VLAFAYDIDEPVNGVGSGRRLPSAGSNVGPTITGKVELKDHRGRPMLLEEGAVPGSLAPLLRPALAVAAAASARAHGADGPTRARLWRDAVSTALLPHRGPMDRTLTYLVMGVDDDAGELRLERDRLRIDWSGTGTSASFHRANDHLRVAASALGGTFLRDPMAGAPFGRSLVTVHPLGGAVMGDDAEHGVVDDIGRVFQGTNGTNRHAGLFVLDGSIVPRPLGINPLLTISALAERACAAIVAGPRPGAGARRSARPAQPGQPAQAAHSRSVRGALPVRTAAPLPGLVFTEAMSGPMSTRAVADRPEQEGSETGPERQAACEAGAAGADALETSTVGFVLTVSFDDLNVLLRDPAHPGRLSGTVTAPALAPEPLVVGEGSFGLFVPDPERAGGSLMRYRMILLAADGTRFRFDGFKVLGRRSVLRTWPDTTALYTTIRDAAGGLGSDDGSTGAIRGMGVLRLKPSDFGRQLTTIRATNVAERRLRSRYQTAFARMFAGNLLRMYGRVLDERPHRRGAGLRVARAARSSRP
jgi:cholesterol oxidase